MSKNFIMAYSCGKDSTLALYRMIERGYKPVCILVTTGDGEDSWFHGINKSLVKKVSESLGIELLFANCSAEKYEENFVSALKEARDKYGAKLCTFGDIDIELHRKWDLDICKKAEIEGILPLWNEDREKLTLEFIKRGFKAVIKKVRLDILNEDFLGKILDEDLIIDIKKAGSDVCGENGEYHTFVFDGPIFKEKVQFNVIEKKTNEKYGEITIN
ncbi:diphthine--ammonia ligase [uncultured Clostridium sp.]|uniref:Dph6-related ATP pyrophosphatase n=1 Tax=uncultured Clostridium sp. TaxID=59620 RepID=UPI00258FC1E2|nr:diphthine--ammonia ligase [uncultured Clostridium sp.]